MADPASIVRTDMDVAGTVTVASAPENSTALSPPGEELSAFTGELVSVLEHGLPGRGDYLGLDEIVGHLQQELRRKSRPVPQILNQNEAHRLPLARNRAAVAPKAPANTTLDPPPQFRRVRSPVRADPDPPHHGTFLQFDRSFATQSNSGEVGSSDSSTASAGILAPTIVRQSGSQIAVAAGQGVSLHPVVRNPYEVLSEISRVASWSTDPLRGLQQAVIAARSAIVGQIGRYTDVWPSVSLTLVQLVGAELGVLHSGRTHGFLVRDDELVRLTTVDPTDAPTLKVVPVQSGDRVLLCTDRVVRKLGEIRILEILKNSSSSQVAGRQLEDQGVRKSFRRAAAVVGFLVEHQYEDLRRFAAK